MAKAKTPRANSTATNKQVIQMPEPGTTNPTTSAPALNESKKNAAPVSIDLQGEIRRRAYELYEERGRTSGFEQEDWATAEREVLARHNQQQSA